MKNYVLAPLCALVACASISGSQSFQATRLFELPAVPAAVGDIGPQTIDAVATFGQLSFANSVLNDVDDLRSQDHIDSADASIRVVSVELTTNTTFAGVSVVRAQLVTNSETIELCNRTLTAAEQRGSTVTCESDHVMDEQTLQDSAASDAQIGAQLVVSSGMTATKLSSVVNFEIQVNVDASL